ncbi:MAG: hypothetical protein HC819_12725 [Cyclobacteriaceae bacterium]|nr:hypothetical protein [Cyclobacteriaceae bacterium]
MQSGFIVALAWPETNCKQAGAWYDALMRWIGVNKNGYYKVGHAALLLISDQTKACEYFDFGRYHAPHGFGRVRDQKTDHDLQIHTVAAISGNGKSISNLPEILEEIAANKSCHGDGQLFAAYTRVNYQKAFDRCKEMQNADFQPYGPFLPQGTNCSRFVNQIIRKGAPSLAEHLLLSIPYSISPSPMANVRSLSSGTYTSGIAEPNITNVTTKLLST